MASGARLSRSPLPATSFRAVAAGYTQEQAAQLLDANVNTVSRIIRGRSHRGAYPVPLGLEPRPVPYGRRSGQGILPFA